MFSRIDFAMIALTIVMSPAIAQTTYTFNGTTWSDGTNTVSGPTFDSTSNIVFQSITDFGGIVQNTGGGTYASGSSIKATGQIFKAEASVPLAAVSFKKNTATSGKSIVLEVYEMASTPPTTSSTSVSISRTHLGSFSFTTGGNYIERVPITGITLEAGKYYILLMRSSTPNPFSWVKANSNAYSNGILLYASYSSSSSLYGTITSFDYWFEVEYGVRVNDLSVPNGGTVSFLGDNLVVKGDLTLSGTLSLAADESSYSGLKVHGSISGSGSVVQNMYLTGSGHHALASPMTDGFATTSGTASALYSYDATTGAYDMSPSTSTAGVGYFGLLGTGGFRTANGTFSVTGTPNTSHTHTLGYATTLAAGGSGNGWNLVGNPYTCALDWTAVTKSAGVTNAFYIWDPLTSTYDYYVNGVSPPTSYAGSTIASPYIAPMQAFWVQTTASGQTLTSTMAASGTVAQAPRLYKTGLDQVILVATSLDDSTKADALWIKNVAGATQGFEAAEDAWKMGNYGGQPELATWSAGDRLAVNAMDLSGPTSVPVDFKAPANGVKYRFRVEADGYVAVLEDRLTGAMHPLSQGPAVLRSAEWTDEVPRLVLHLNPSVALGVSSIETPEFWAFATADAVLLHATSPGWAELLSLDGRVLDRQRVEPGVSALGRPQVSGVYLVRSGAQTAKIWVP